jgi:hypothetical protein
MTRLKPQSTLRQKAPVIKDPAYMEYMKQLCMVHGCVLCWAPAERAHIRMAEVCAPCQIDAWDYKEFTCGAACSACNDTGYRFGKLPTGMSERDDPWIVPLCPNHHRLLNESQHGMNERIWWQAQEIDPLALCKRLQEAYDPDNSALSIERGCEVLRSVR